MNNFLIALMLAAGIATLVYTKMGRRMGYGNSGSVWTLVGMSFAISFLIVFIMLKTLIDL